MKSQPIANLPEHLQFISDSQDVEPINEQYDQDFGSYFVEVGEGDYVQIWGVEGIIPWNHKHAWKVK